MSPWAHVTPGGEPWPLAKETPSVCEWHRRAESVGEGEERVSLHFGWGGVARESRA